MYIITFFVGLALYSIFGIFEALCSLAVLALGALVLLIMEPFHLARMARLDRERKIRWDGWQKAADERRAREAAEGRGKCQVPKYLEEDDILDSDELEEIEEERDENGIPYL